MMIHLKMEGAPIHPDDIDAEMSDEFYIKQLQAYVDTHKIKRGEEFMIRIRLEDKIKWAE